MSQRISRRDFLRMSAAGGIGVVLAACAAPAPTAAPVQPAAVQPTPTPAQPTAGPPTPTTAPAMPAEKTQVQLLIHFGGKMKDAFQEAVDKFNASQDKAEVSVTWVSHPELWPKVLASIAAGVPPDSFTYAPTFPADLVVDGHCSPVEDYMTWPDDVFPSFDVLIDGKRWGIPVEGATKELFYNADLFREVGLDPDKPPKTWEELVEQGLKITDPAKKQFAISLPTQPFSFLTDVWLNFVYQAGGQYLSEDNSKAAFNTDAGLEATTYWVDLFQKYKIAPLEALDGAGVIQIYQTGSVGMLMQSSVVAGDASSVPFETRGAEMPMHKQKATAMTPDFFPLMKTGREQGTVEWFKFWLEPEQLATWCKGLKGALPPRKSAQDHQIFQDFLKQEPLAQAAVAGVEYSFAFPSIVGSDEILTKISESLEASMYGRMEPKEALQQAEAAVNKVLQGS
jgi:sn-glycerol 3-phosphate transport system substrate-binding protein